MIDACKLQLSQQQFEKIRKNLLAFVENFGAVRIDKDRFNRGQFYVYYPADARQYMQHCSSLEYLNGWLYGVVQGALKFPKNEYGE